MTWFEIKYNPFYLGLRTKQIYPTDSRFTEELQKFLTYRGELGIVYGFIPGPLFLDNNWQLLHPSKYSRVSGDEIPNNLMENKAEVIDRYGNNFIKIGIYPSCIKTSKLFPTSDEELGASQWLSEALIPAYEETINPETGVGLEERVRKDLVSGFLRVWISGLFHIYIPEQPKTWAIFLKARKKGGSFLDYYGSIGVSEVNLVEGKWNILGSVSSFYGTGNIRRRIFLENGYYVVEVTEEREEISLSNVSPYYWAPDIIRVGLVRMEYVSPYTGYDDLGLGKLGIDRETWDRFSLLHDPVYMEGGEKILVIFLSGWLRDEISEDLELAQRILGDVSYFSFLINI